MEDEKNKQNDHDILIELKTEFRLFREEQSSNWSRFNSKLSRLFETLDQKADKSELLSVQKDIVDVKTRVGVLEQGHLIGDGKKDGYKTVGNFALKVWGLITGGVLFIIALYNFILTK